MPLDTASWKTVSIHGKYPAARLFNFTTYTDTGRLEDSVLDRDIGPDPGSTNPFSSLTAAGLQNYTLTISAADAATPNTLRLAPSRVTFVVYRLYVPDRQSLARQAFENSRPGADRTGGAGLPSVSV